MTTEEIEIDIITMKGSVREILPDFTFMVELENGMIMPTKGSGRLRKKRIKIAIMDTVEIEISKYNVNLGRISKRIDEKKGDGEFVRKKHNNNNKFKPHKK